MMLESKFTVSALLAILIFIQTSYIDGYVQLPLRCLLERNEGHTCLAKISMYYYNVGKGECQKFIYSGCYGNENRFATKAQCEAACNVNLKPAIKNAYANEDPKTYKRTCDNPKWCRY